jgi:predicted ABC-type ATPase
MAILTVIAGPNGGGKNTFARALKLPSIDPDQIAASYGEGFTDRANVRAARGALQLTTERLERREHPIVETTLAGRQPLRVMTQAREAGDQVLLAFIVPNAQDDTRFRIDNRVPEDGHTIPDADLKRREPRILAHLPETIMLADLTAISISSTRSQDFTLEGAIDGDEVQLTDAVPPQVRTAIARRSEVRDVAVISDDHPVAGPRSRGALERGPRSDATSVTINLPTTLSKPGPTCCYSSRTDRRVL